MIEKDNTVVSMIVDEIRQQILDNKFVTGYRLREIELSKQFGVSRTPVREALRNLEACGLVQIIPHKGAIVRTQLSEKVISDKMVVWRLLSSESGLLAAKNASQEQKKELMRIIDEMNELLNPTLFISSKATTLDWKFHRKIAEMSGNSVLELYIIQINEQFLIVSDELKFQFERYQESMMEHANIAKAIVRGEAENAYDYTQIHFRHSEDSNRKKVKEYRKKFSPESN